MKSLKNFSKLNYFLLTLVLIGSFVFSAPPAQAQFGIVNDIWAGIRDGLRSAWQHSGSILYQNVFGTAVKKIAYDTATWLGSGGKGQKPLFDTKDIQSRLIDAGNSALGQFLETAANPTLTKDVYVPGTNGQRGKYVSKPMTDKNGKPLNGVNLCTPDLNILKRITLGLGADISKTEQKSGLCDWQTLQQNWQTEFDMVNSMVVDGNFGKKLMNSLDPGGNDISIAQGLINASAEKEANAKLAALRTRNESGRWLDVTKLISGKIISVPESAKNQQNEAKSLFTLNFAKSTNDILVDSANIFLNQLALTAFNKLMNSLGDTSDDNAIGGISNQYVQGNTGGITELNRATSKLIQAQFSEQADYNILSKLTICDNESNPGPTDCVIDEQFAQAIEQQLTVAQAVSSNGNNNDRGGGLLDANKRIGFDDQGNDLSYKDGYPYRSLIILRKYRILPVGWEVAAQYMKTHLEETKTVTLKQLLQCFSATDTSYPGYHETWCDGLIDPNWVLKLPKLYCGMQGYGPEIVNTSIMPSNIGYCSTSSSLSDPITDCSANPDPAPCATNWKTCTKDGDTNCTSPYEKCNFTIAKSISVMRANDYCADEQSCIKENSNGSCANFGYCTEEKRLWKFSQETNNTCEARNNTCQTFKNDTGLAMSFLENTLDYSSCNANQVGCKKYATTGVYTPGTMTTSEKMAWDASTDARYFNKNITDCDSRQEGCHEFIRTKDDLDANLIADSNFEDVPCIAGQGSESFLPNNKFNPFVKTALAQAGEGSCQLTNISSPGAYLPSPTNRWYIRVNSGSVRAGIVNDKAADDSGQSLYIEGAGGFYSTEPSNILPTGFAFENDRFYTLSAMVYVVAGKVRIGFGSEANGQVAETTGTGAWQPMTVIYYRPANGATNFYIEGFDSSAKFYIDEVKLTVGENSTAYTEYGENSLVYEKLLPTYLEASCYKALGNNPDYKIKDNAPSQCFNYARKCNSEEVGCEKYTSINTGINVTAKVKPKDFCPDSCIGYDVFVEQPTSFSAIKSAYFIPSTAQQCSSQAVGCTAFTNLDKLAQGGEAKEYYSYLRTCIKPDVNSCDEFYTWEGSDDTGYQLRVFSLKKATNNEPASTLESGQENSVCNETIFNKLPSDPGYNYDCRAFYNRSGDVSYHLYSRTISCSDDCHPYRREVASAQICTDGGGTWDSTQSRCLYYSIPREGTTCSEAEVGCREYTGNIASNVREVFSDEFDPLSTTEPTSGWSGAEISNTALNLSEHSIKGTTMSKLVGKYDLSVNPATYGVKQDESYTISFLAKSLSGNDVIIQGIDLVNAKSTPDSAAFSVSSGAKVGNDWRIYTFNLDKLNHEVSPIVEEGGSGSGPGTNTFTGEKLRLNFSAPVYIDNIILTEIPDRHFLITDSWSTPDECDQTVTGAYWPQYMLGCSQYRDSAGTKTSLHGFSQLCQDSAAGCEQMIDTQNSDDYKKQVYNDDNYNGAIDPTDNNGVCDPGETSCVTIAPDKIINVVYDKTKQCDLGNKGCQRLGLATTYNSSTIYSNVYKINNPNNYNSVLCEANAVGCSEWSDNNNGTIYFKDPGDMTCEWRLPAGSQNGVYKWLKKKVKTCAGDPTKNLCTTDNDCLKKCGGIASGNLCTTDIDCNNVVGSCKPVESCTLIGDANCDTTYNKTVGSGGVGNRTLQPATWAGVCDSNQAGCTEYIDPLSKFNENLILNPNYKDLDTTTAGIEYWQDWVDPNNNQIVGAKSKQTISLSPQTIYIIKGAGLRTEDKSKIRIDCPKLSGNEHTADTLMVLDANNNFSTVMENGQPSYTTPWVAGGIDESLEFYYQSSSADSVQCRVYRTKRDEGNAVYLRSAIVDYQLAQNLDRTSPNGLVNIDSGLILFNERAQNAASKKSLVYNADKTFDTGVDGMSPGSGAPLNANVILKVKPDRSCAKWLSCLTYVPDPKDASKKTCLQVGLCDKMGLDGKCNSFIETTAKQNQSTNAVSKIGNLSGYSKVGYVDPTTGSATFDDYYNLASMNQTGEAVDVANGSFETVDAGWDLSTGTGAQILNQPAQLDALNLAAFSLIKGAGSITTNLAPDGKGLLQLPSTTKAIHTAVPLSANSRYVITFYAYINSDGLTVDFDDLSPTNADFTLDPLRLANNAVKNKWVKYSLGFKAMGNSYKISFNNNNNNPPLVSNGDVYIDDVRITPGLNIRCANPDNAGDPSCSKPENPDPSLRPQYIGSSCRLYARENSLACSYIDEQNIRHKGLYGYCLEADPRNPANCLLWYPTSRVVGDQDEELPTINWTGDAYYCVDAKDRCSVSDSLKPEFYCNQFIKVNKSYAWYQRMSDGSNFKMPDNTSSGKHCNRTGLSCTTTADCPDLYPVCQSGVCTITGSPCINSCLTFHQTCIDDGPKFPDFPTFWSPNPPAPTSVRQIDFGGKAGGNPSIVTVNSITRNMSAGRYFGGLLSAGVPTGNQGVVEKNGTDLNFLPYYGLSSGEECYSKDANNNPKGIVGWYLPPSIESCGNGYWVGATDDGTTTANPISDWDMCGARWSLGGDIKGNPSGCVAPNQWKELGNLVECAHNAASCNSYWAHTKTCRVNSLGSRTWQLEGDNYSSSDDVGCGAFCYNRTNSFTIAKGVNQAEDALKRIFINRYPSTTDPKAWQLYTLSGNSYGAGVPVPATSVPDPKRCANDVRPKVVNTSAPPTDPTNDYCFIPPQITTFKINNKNNETIRVYPSDPYVTLEINTKTDPEQLPIKSLVVDWGYDIDNNGTREATPLGTNLADRVRSVTKRLNYDDIKSVPANNCNITEYCEITVKIKITDSWDYSTEALFAGQQKKVRVYKEDL